MGFVKQPQPYEHPDEPVTVRPAGESKGFAIPPDPSKSQRQQVLEGSLEKKQKELDRRFDNHFEFAASTNGQPLNDKGAKGQAALNKMDKQNDSIRNQIAEVDKTKNAIDREEYRHESSQTALGGMPDIVKNMVGSGELKQWRKFPDHFFVDGVDKGRIIIKDGAAHHKYLSDVPKDQYGKFRDTFNSINKSLRDEQEAFAINNPAELTAPVQKKASPVVTAKTAAMTHYKANKSDYEGVDPKHIPNFVKSFFYSANKNGDQFRAVESINTKDAALFEASGLIDKIDENGKTRLTAKGLSLMSHNEGIGSGNWERDNVGGEQTPDSTHQKTVGDDKNTFQNSYNRNNISPSSQSGAANGDSKMSAKRMSEMTSQEISEAERLYDKINNEGGEGYNPYRDSEEAFNYYNPSAGTAKKRTFTPSSDDLGVLITKEEYKAINDIQAQRRQKYLENLPLDELNKRDDSFSFSVPSTASHPMAGKTLKGGRLVTVDGKKLIKFSGSHPGEKDTFVGVEGKRDLERDVKAFEELSQKRDESFEKIRKNPGQMKRLLELSEVIDKGRWSSETSQEKANYNEALRQSHDIISGQKVE
jgi:hypothetical protein